MRSGTPPLSHALNRAHSPVPPYSRRGPDQPVYMALVTLASACSTWPSPSNRHIEAEKSLFPTGVMDNLHARPSVNTESLYTPLLQYPLVIMVPVGCVSISKWSGLVIRSTYTYT